MEKVDFGDRNCVIDGSLYRIACLPRKYKEQQMSSLIAERDALQRTFGLCEEEREVFAVLFGESKQRDMSAKGHALLSKLKATIRRERE